MGEGEGSEAGWPQVFGPSQVDGCCWLSHRHPHRFSRVAKKLGGSYPAVFHPYGKSCFCNLLYCSYLSNQLTSRW